MKIQISEEEKNNSFVLENKDELFSENEEYKSIISELEKKSIANKYFKARARR